MRKQTLENGFRKRKPHVVLVPLVAQGHMIPMTDFARLLAESGAIVTCITTAVNASRIRPIIDRMGQLNLSVRFVELPFPCAKVGLPEGCENLDLVPSKELFFNFFDGLGMLRSPFSELLRELLPQPSCVVFDMCNPWAAEAAREQGIPRFVFHGPSCIYILFNHIFQKHNIYEKVSDDFEPVLLPEMPVPIEATKAQAPGWFNNPGFERLRDSIKESEAAANGVVMNTFDELEPLFIKTYKKVASKKVWTVGPMCLYDKDTDMKAIRGNAAAIDRHRLLKWLDAMEPKSVLYISFGSLARVNIPQLMEIGLGLEASEKPFVWVIRDIHKTPELEKWLSAGFEERTSTRGLVIKGWAPQAAILAHHAVGGFLTHAGWNSTLEAICAGVPMLTWPQFADQFLNERLVVEYMRAGIAIGVKKPVLYLADDEVVIGRDDVEKAVRSLMDDGAEAAERRVRAGELRKMALKATEEGGSSYQNMTEWIEYIVETQGKHDIQGK